MSMGGQFLHLLRLLVRFKGYRGAFLFITAVLMCSFLWVSILTKHLNQSEKKTADALTFYSLSDFASSGEKVLMDRSAFPAEADAAASIVSAKGGSTSWITNCSSEIACRAQFISELDPSVVAYIRYANKNIRRHILECFRVDKSDQRCAILYELMVQSILTKTGSQLTFEDVQIFKLREDEDGSSKNKTNWSSNDSICKIWVDRLISSSLLVLPLLLMTAGLTVYFLATTISFIGILKQGGFYKQLVRNGLSVTCYWTTILLVSVIECITFSGIFVLSIFLPCPGVFAPGNLAMVFIIVSVYFIELMALALLLEIIISSMIAVAVLMMILSFTITAVFGFYSMIVLKRPFIAYTVPLIQIMNYIERYVTSGASTGESKTPAIENPALYNKMLAVNIITAILLILMTAYVDFLLLSGNGLRLPAHFPFIGRFWFPADNAKTENNETLEDKSKEVVEPHIEPVVGVKPSIIVDRVSKIYKCCPCMPSAGRPKVLQELSCKIYKNQITALIGHNGAGKSTLIKILTGDENPDSGSAHIGGIQVTDPIERLALRGGISVCPQFDALCEALSVIECIQITLISKGVSGNSELERARSMLKRLGLGDKENVMSTDLSGGQKRKVSTILALLGDPKVVFLDEPTSGLDPVSRRQLWQLLQEEKRSRSIVLCTQFMDEADILADRKIFLCGGNIVCAGSSMFLKRAFGCCFTITVSLKSERDAQKLLSQLKEVQLKSQFKTELQLEVPASKPNVLIAAVQALEGAREIEAFGLSQANLDDVFMKLSGVSSTDVIDAFRSGNLSKLQNKPNSDVMVNVKDDLSKLSERPVKLKPSCMAQFRAIFKINLRKQWRTSSTFWSRYVISGLLLLLLGIFVFMVKKKSTPDGAIKNMSPCEVQNYLNNLDVNSAGTAYSVPGDPASWLVRSERLKFSIGTVCLHDEGSSMASFNQSCSDLTLIGSQNMASEMSKPQDEDLKSFLLRNSTRQELRKRCEIGLCDAMKKPGGCKICLIYYASTWDILTENSGRKIFIGVFILDPKFDGDLVHVYRGAMEKIWEFFGNPDMNKLVALSHVKPLTSFFHSNVFPMLILVFSLFPVSYLSDPIDDITSRVINQLLSMGMTYQAYWLNLFSLHWIQYVVCFLIAIGISFIVDDYRQWQYFTYAIIPVLLFGTTSIQLFMYVIASVTRTKSTLVVLLCNFAALMWPMVVMSLTNNEQVLVLLIVLLPPVAPIAMIFYGLLPAHYTKIYYQADSIKNTPGAFDNYWNHSYVFWPVTMMPIHIVILLCGLILSECRQTLRSILCAMCSPKRPVGKKNSDQMDKGGSTDPGAQKEHNRLMQKAQNEDNVLEVRQLSKIYPNGVHAVRGVTFGVMSGEIFGLLGANGAGKSTSMSVIVGEELETDGSVQVRSQDGRWSSGRSGASTGVIGYCPQHDPLFDFITVAEHLVLYAGIRGVPANAVQLQTDALMKGLGLQRHKDKLSSELSGGNKRRLCLAIALLGDPTLIVIDEASTGVDPENKRFIWAAIRGMLKEQRAVMVTTHSMEEVEALCNRVAIMNRGKIIAFGTVQQIQSQHGDVYTLDVLLSQDSTGSLQLEKAAIKRAVAKQFKNAALLEDLGLCMQFAVPKKSVGSLSGALKWLYANQTKLGMVSYSFCQISLDQVFVKLVKLYDSSSGTV